jgi:hypothetical protein
MKTLSKLFFVGLLGLSGLLISQTTMAQTTRAGIKGGLNVSNLYIDDVDDENARYGINVGFYGQIFSTETFAIQPELLFSTKGSKEEYGGLIDQEIKFNLNYIDLPVLAVIKLGESAEIHLGGYASYLLGANINYEGDVANGTDELDKDHFKSFDYGLVGGFALNFGAAQIGARYNYGLAKIADSDNARDFLGDAKNSCAQLYLALNLNAK